MNRLEKKTVFIVCATIVTIALIVSMTVLAISEMWPLAIGVLLVAAFNQFLSYLYY